MVYTMEPFRKIADRDKSKDKLTAIKEISFVYFMKDYQSPFLSIIDTRERSEEVVKAIKMPAKWTADQMIYDCMSLYDELQKTESSRMLESARKAINKLQDYLESVDFTDKTTSGNHVNDPKKINDILKTLPDTLKGFNDVKEIVKKEHVSNKKSRGGRSIGMLERMD